MPTMSEQKMSFLGGKSESEGGGDEYEDEYEFEDGEGEEGEQDDGPGAEQQDQAAAAGGLGDGGNSPMEVAASNNSARGKSEASGGSRGVQLMGGIGGITALATSLKTSEEALEEGHDKKKEADKKLPIDDGLSSMTADDYLKMRMIPVLAGG